MIAPIGPEQLPFFGNGAASGGAIYRSNAGSALYLTSTLITRGIADPGGNCAGLSINGAANSISSDGTCALTTVTPSANNADNADPLLGPLAWNGGATQTHMPQALSPAIDRSPSGPSLDQRGAARPYGASYDAGSVEVGPVVPSIFPYATFVPVALR